VSVCLEAEITVSYSYILLTVAEIPDVMQHMLRAR
jgi:hypothetical protein